MSNNFSFLPMGAAAAVIASACLAPEASAATVFSANFESGSIPAEISGSGVVTGTEGFGAFGFGTNYLRNDSASQSTILTLAGLGAHTHVSLSFSLAIIDSWDGNGGNPGPDSFVVTMGGTTVFSQVFASASGTADHSETQLNPVGNYVQTGWNDQAYNLNFSIPHTASNLDISWTATGPGWQAGGDESFAIDNIEVVTRDVVQPPNGVPEGGSAVVMLGLSLLGVAAARKSLAKTA